MHYLSCIVFSHSKSDLYSQPTAGILKRTSIYYSKPKTQPAATGQPHSFTNSSQVTVSPLKPRNVDTSRPQARSCMRKQVAWADQGTSMSNHNVVKVTL